MDRKKNDLELKKILADYYNSEFSRHVQIILSAIVVIFTATEVLTPNLSISSEQFTNLKTSIWIFLIGFTSYFVITHMWKIYFFGLIWLNILNISYINWDNPINPIVIQTKYQRGKMTRLFTELWIQKYYYLGDCFFTGLFLMGFYLRIPFVSESLIEISSIWLGLFFTSEFFTFWLYFILPLFYAFGRIIWTYNQILKQDDEITEIGKKDEKFEDFITRHQNDSSIKKFISVDNTLIEDKTYSCWIVSWKCQKEKDELDVFIQMKDNKIVKSTRMLYSLPSLV